MTELADAPSLPETMFTLSRVGNAAVVSLTCPAIREKQAQTLGRYLRDLSDQVQGRIVLEVAGVGSFSCAWINELLRLTQRCRSMGGNLVLSGMPERDARVLRSTGLLQHLCLMNSRSEAINLLGGCPVAPWRLAVARLLDIPVAEPSRIAA